MACQKTKAVPIIRRKEAEKKFWEELIAYIPSVRRGHHIKRRLQQCFVAAGTSLPSSYLATVGGYARATILLLMRALFVAGACLPSRCLAMKRRIHFIEPLPSNDMRETHTDTQVYWRYL
jgi:hypothetical protein